MQNKDAGLLVIYNGGNCLRVVAELFNESIQTISASTRSLF